MNEDLKISIESDVTVGVCKANANNLLIGCNGRNYCL